MAGIASILLKVLGALKGAGGGGGGSQGVSVGPSAPVSPDAGMTGGQSVGSAPPVNGYDVQQPMSLEEQFGMLGVGGLSPEGPSSTGSANMYGFQQPPPQAAPPQIPQQAPQQMPQVPQQTPQVAGGGGIDIGGAMSRFKDNMGDVNWMELAKKALPYVSAGVGLGVEGAAPYAAAVSEGIATGQERERTAAADTLKHERAKEMEDIKGQRSAWKNAYSLSAKLGETGDFGGMEQTTPQQLHERAKVIYELQQGSSKGTEEIRKEVGEKYELEGASSAKRQEAIKMLQDQSQPIEEENIKYIMDRL